jgi:hypothetical protein
MMCEQETLFHFVSCPIANHDGGLCINHPDVSIHAYQITHELKMFDYAPCLDQVRIFESKFNIFGA